VLEDIERTLMLGPDPADGLVRGGELEVTATPLSRLVLTSTLGVTTTRYTSIADIPAKRALESARFPFTPTYTMAFAASYSLPVGSLGDLRTRFSWRHEGTRGQDTLDTRITRLGKRGMLAGRVGFDLKDGRTSVALFGSNLLDREVVTNVIDLSGVNGSVQEIFAPPRQYGLEISHRF
jgi:outer membrane receptor protein involved in Fe transport